MVNSPNSPSSMKPSLRSSKLDQKNSPDPKLAQIYECVTKTEKRTVDIEKSQALLILQINEIKKELSSVLKENEMLKSKITELESNVEIANRQIATHEQKLSYVENELEFLKQSRLKNNLVLAGIPDRQQSPKVVSLSIFETINANIQESDIIDCHYMGKDRKLSSNLILVKLKSSELKKEILLKKKQFKNLFTEQIRSASCERSASTSSEFIFPASRYSPINQIFIREDLTRAKIKLFQESRILKNQLGFKFLWIKDSNILLRKSEDSEIIKINQLADLSSLSSNQI